MLNLGQLQSQVSTQESTQVGIQLTQVRTQLTQVRTQLA